MLLRRREFLQFAVTATAVSAAAPARGESYPARPVHLVEGFGAGSAPDIVARLIGQWLSERLGQSFIIENRSGASSNIATEAVIHAPADGYTLLLVTSANPINGSVFKLSFDFQRDIAPIATICWMPLVMEVHPSIPATSVEEFIAYAKARPGKINMASAGVGSITHMAGELFKLRAGVDLLHVPYRGAQVFPAMLSGEAQVYFGPLLSSIEHIRSGKLRALAVTTDKRWHTLPDIEAVAEALPGFEVTTWYGVGAPRSIAPAIVETLNREINASLTDPKLVALLANLGSLPLAGSPADFAKLIADESRAWSKVAAAAHMQPP